jgi:hypothetical protein
MSARGVLILVAALGAAPPPALALSDADLQVHGVLSQGWLLSDGNNVNGSSDDAGGSGEFRELGVNVSWHPAGSLLFAAQTAAVENGKAIDEDVNLEYGLVDWTPLSGERGRIGARAGRLKLPIGFYNDSRDAVFTRPGIIMPNSVYLETNGARSFGYFSLDGGGAYADWLAGEQALYVELIGAGPQELGANAEIAILRNPASGHFELDQAFIGRIAEDYAGGRVRAALSILSSRLRYTNASGGLFTDDGTLRFDQAVLSLQYNWECVSITAEATARHIELDDLNQTPTPAGFVIAPVKQDPAGYYVQGSLRVTPQWQWTLRYDEQIRDIQDRHGREQAAAPGGLPRHYYFADDWTIATRYDLLSNVAVWAEFHYVDGVGWVNPLDNPGFNSGGAERYWNLFTTMVGVRF